MKWKMIFNDYYSVSDTGIVKSNDRYVNTITGIRHFKEKILIPEITNDGHMRVTLSDAGKTKRIFVHRLVAEAFIPNPNNYPVINHKDENPQNNNADNLEWCTVAYNNAYNNRHQRVGDSEGYSVNVLDEDNNVVDRFESISKFCEKYNIPLTTAWRRFKDGKTINSKYHLIAG